MTLSSSKHVPVTVDITDDPKAVYGMAEGEVALRFTKHYSENHTEREVVRLTSGELWQVQEAIDAYTSVHRTFMGHAG